MDRRGFLVGAFHSVTAAGLVVAAQSDAIEAFVQPLVKDAPLVLTPPVVPPVDVGMSLYSANGDLVAVIREVRITTSPVDGMMHDLYPHPRYVRGVANGEIRAELVGPYLPPFIKAWRR